jgi:hypothetical protein
MKTRCTIAFLFFSAVILLVTPGLGLNLPSNGPDANIVFGQPGYTTSTAGAGTTQFDDPNKIAVDDSGVIYVSDANNNRVLVFFDTLDTTPDKIIGTGSSGTSANEFNVPTALAVWQGSDTTVLFICDQLNRRVLAYIVRQTGSSAILADTQADYVFGQHNFTSNVSNNNGQGGSGYVEAQFIGDGNGNFDSVSRVGFVSPCAVTVLDTGGSTISVFIGDQGIPNLRALRFDLAKTSLGAATIDTVPKAVWGQSGFDTALRAAARPATNNFYLSAQGLAVSPRGDRLYVLDGLGGARRVMVESLTDTDNVFDAVFGVPDLNTLGGTANSFSQAFFSAPLSLALSRDGKYLAVGDAFNDDMGGGAEWAFNGRILIFADTTGLVDTLPSRVIGDTDFVHNAFDISETTQRSLRLPSGLAYHGDALWLSDGGFHRVVRYGGAIQVAPVSQVISTSPSDTSPVISSPPVGTTETYVQINLQGNDTTAGTLASAADSIGTGADYTLKISRLVSPADTAVIHVWTNQAGAAAVLLGFRSDTETLDTNNLPPGVPNSAAGRQAFGASIILTEFVDQDGNLLGDTVTTTNIGSKFAYTMVYNLSETTTRAYRDLGFDTSPGSSSFRFYYADTYGGAWIWDSGVTVTVETGSANGIKVRAAGITKDLPGGLGGVSGSSAAAVSNSSCILQALEAPGPILVFLRTMRDEAMATVPGRWMVLLYYAISGLLL